MAARRNHGTETHPFRGSTVDSGSSPLGSPGPESITLPRNLNTNGKEAYVSATIHFIKTPTTGPLAGLELPCSFTTPESSVALSVRALERNPKVSRIRVVR